MWIVVFHRVYDWLYYSYKWFSCVHILFRFAYMQTMYLWILDSDATINRGIIYAFLKKLWAKVCMNIYTIQIFQQTTTKIRMYALCHLLQMRLKSVSCQSIQTKHITDSKDGHKNHVSITFWTNFHQFNLLILPPKLIYWHFDKFKSKISIRHQFEY